GPGLLDGARKQTNGGVCLQPGEVVVVLLLEALDQFTALVAFIVDVADTDIFHAIQPAFAHGGGRALQHGVIGVEVGVESGRTGGADQQGKVGAPVTGDDGVSAGGDDLRNVRREILHFTDGVEIIAHDFDVRAL